MNPTTFQKIESHLKELERILASNEKYAEAPQLLNLAEQVVEQDSISPEEIIILHRYLDLTRQSNFLLSLKDNEERYKWADCIFEIIRVSNYSLNDLFQQRVNSHPDKTFLATFDDEIRKNYSYKRIYNILKKIAIGFYSLKPEKPKVAIYSENNLETACVDLSCLTFDIFVSPLHTHFNTETLIYIFNKMNFDIVVTDNDNRAEILNHVREKVDHKFTIINTSKLSQNENIKQIRFDSLVDSIEIDKSISLLDNRIKFSLDDNSTTMFTSGSTGMPKGVCFSNFNLISKRFARAAALPKVGNDELLLSYLPLFHTFGRYLEMMGMLFWGGTYVFAGKSDIDSIIKLMNEVNPTGFISIPLRWKQINEKYREEYLKLNDKNFKQELFYKLTGKNLRWGLSAAGYLEPKVFHFFNAYKVELCSGFGMTEATGGISMTIPGKYVKDSVGLPLPGVNIRFSDEGELQINGPYIASYLADENPTTQKERWLKTGDLFKQDEDGHLFIIDRIKDIYKNSKGQTIAPAFIEKKFENIPGLKRAFLVGDMKPYNTLLIVPDYEEDFIKQADSQNKLRDYFSSLVTTINLGLSAYERIVRFTLIKRNFEESKGELTAKGTFKRKTIEINFAKEIDELYQKSKLKFECGGLKVTIPLWLLKDLGITEEDIECEKDLIKNKQNSSSLIIKKERQKGKIRVGNFIYSTQKAEIDLGVFVRQPILWVGNVSLINFAICIDDWDMDFAEISSQIFVNRETNSPIHNKFIEKNLARIPGTLKVLNSTIITMLYGKVDETLSEPG